MTDTELDRAIADVTLMIFEGAENQVLLDIETWFSEPEALVGTNSDLIQKLNDYGYELIEETIRCYLINKANNEYDAKFCEDGGNI